MEAYIFCKDLMKISLCIVDIFIVAEYKESEENNKLIEKIMEIEEEQGEDKQVQLCNNEFLDGFLDKWDRGEYHD